MNRLRPECMACILRKQLEDIPKNASEQKKMDYMKRVFEMFSNAPVTMDAPVLARNLFDIQQEMFSKKHEFGEIKKYFNGLMMKFENTAREKIGSNPHPLKLSVKYAMVGNYIDFGAVKNVSREQLRKLLNNVEDIKINEKQYQKLRADIIAAKKLVYLTDNCGEIVMDKVLIDSIKTLCPQVDITVIVRGDDVLNDATLEDAKQTGLTESCRVIGSGNTIAGTYLPELSKEALDAFKAADVIISKGQGNFETLHHSGYNIYHMFLVKCDLFARDFGVEKFSGMLINDRDLK